LPRRTFGKDAQAIGGSASHKKEKKYALGNNMKTLEAFYTALENHDWKGARALLHDNFRFRGPSQQADSVDDFIATNRQINPDWKFRDVEMTEDANIIMSFFTTIMTRPAQGSNRCAERVEIRHGKLASIELIYDSAGFRPLPV